jgi:hypothetical protein
LRDRLAGHYREHCLGLQVLCGICHGPETILADCTPRLCLRYRLQCKQSFYAFTIVAVGSRSRRGQDARGRRARRLQGRAQPGMPSWLLKPLLGVGSRSFQVARGRRAWRL